MCSLEFLDYINNVENSLKLNSEHTNLWSSCTAHTSFPEKCATPTEPRKEGRYLQLGALVTVLALPSTP